MTDVRVLELGGNDAPHLRIDQWPLDDLEVALRARSGAHFRLLELTVTGAPRLDWGAIERLRVKALTLLSGGGVIERLLRERDSVRLEVSGAPRELRSTLEALRAQAMIAAPMIVVDIALSGVVAHDHRRMMEAWAQLLTVHAPLARPRIARAPPVQTMHAAAAARARLDALLGDTTRFLDSVGVGRQLSGNPAHANPKMITTRARQAGRLVGAWAGNGYRYPVFQFGADGQPRPEVPALLEVLPRDPGETDGGCDAALWLFTPEAALDGRTPAEVFVDDPARVIALAHTRRSGPQ